MSFIFNIIQSMLALLFGIQSNKKRKEDFTKGNPFIYFTVGLIMLIVLILSFIMLVKAVIFLGQS